MAEYRHVFDKQCRVTVPGTVHGLDPRRLWALVTQSMTLPPGPLSRDEPLLDYWVLQLGHETGDVDVTFLTPTSGTVVLTELEG